MAAENQAYDRAHRIGQSKPVQIKRFIVKDTIEARQASIRLPDSYVVVITLTGWQCLLPIAESWNYSGKSNKWQTPLSERVTHLFDVYRRL